MQISEQMADQNLKRLIEAGENQYVDFKYCVSDSRKIARSMVAFSNSEGGRLLIGVRDNGGIAGIRSDEEIYMVETAVELYCRPEIKYTLKQHNFSGKTILEVEVLKGDKRPYRAKDDEGKWIAWFRQNDQNLAANRVLLKVWEKADKQTGIVIRFGFAETKLIEYLSKNENISISGFRKITGITTRRAELILANMIILKIITINSSVNGFYYKLNKDYDEQA